MAALLALVDDVLEVGRLDAGAALDEVVFDPLTLVEEAVCARAAAHGPAGAGWLIVAAGNVARSLVGDARRLRRIIDDLIVHAAATARSDRLSVRVATASRARGQVDLAVTVTDAGPARRLGDGSWSAAPASAAPGQTALALVVA
ncbi:MAG: hypothetical protein GW802_15285, partial [Armatimonadetes bacterium]|nr:hypothetical protein [Armatimonadota bacterium]